MAPGIAGTVIAYDLRFDGKRLSGDLEEIGPLPGAREGPLRIGWQSAQDPKYFFVLHDRLAYVEKLDGYAKSTQGTNRTIDQSGEGEYYRDLAILERHGAALILVLPKNYTLDENRARPIACDNAQNFAVRLSAKDFDGRIAICYIVEPLFGVQNVRVRWWLSKATGDLQSHIDRINGLVQPSGSIPDHFRLITTAGLSSETKPSSSPIPRIRTWWKWAAGFMAILVLSLIALHIWPTLASMIGVQGASVHVPQSHWVGDHGKNKKIIIFVHGVMGDMDNTWINPVANTSWPELIKRDPQFSDFDVYVYGYLSPALGKASNISDIANRFRQQLSDLDVFNNYEEIDFITHSMGGIVTKRMLVMLNTPQEIDNLRKVHCVIFLSVPANGADLAALASWISQNPQFKSMSPDDAVDFLNTVENDWAQILRSRSPDCASCQFPRSYTAYETLSTRGLTVVPKLYISGQSDLPAMPFDYDHIDIVKPAGRNSDVYVWVRARILGSSSHNASSQDGEPSKTNQAARRFAPPGATSQQMHIDKIDQSVRNGNAVVGVQGGDVNINSTPSDKDSKAKKQ